MSQRDISFQDGGATDHFLKYQFICELKNKKKIENIEFCE